MIDDIEKRLREIEISTKSKIINATSPEELKNIRVNCFGKRGELNKLLRSLGKLPADDRPRIGSMANNIRDELGSILKDREIEIELNSQEEQLSLENIDVTMPGIAGTLGTIHPITQTIQEISQIFVSLGFEIVEGPEVEDEWHNFIALNIPTHHPARDDHDSFYIEDDILLRTETSSVQIRTMENRKPPIRIISPGRVYRRDQVDRTHSHTFHQLEGLFLDENVTFSDLKGTLQTFAQIYFSSQTVTRFRPHHFPFTQPSAEVDVSCVVCKGNGCGLCKGTGWVEVLGCGMVHPKVLENVGYDNDIWNGFAFGMGIERLCMIRHRINDIRLFYENDIRFLQQF